MFSQSVEARISVTVFGASRHAGLQALDVTVNAFSTMYHIHDCEYIAKKKKKACMVFYCSKAQRPNEVLLSDPMFHSGC